MWKEKKEIHPSLNIDDSCASIGIWLMQRTTDEKGHLVVKEVPHLVTTNRELIRLDGDDFHLKNNLPKFKNRWEMESIQAFIAYKNECPSMKEIFDEIVSEMKDYIEFDDDVYYDLVALWIIGTYFHPIFDAYPYLFMNAIKQSGKTKLLNFISCLAFNAKNTLSLTASTLFRLASEGRCTLLMDEEEKLQSKDVGEFRSLILGGYKKGTLVPRAEQKGNKKQFSVSEYDVYCPKAIANINGIEDVLEDRCITIIMKRAKNHAISNKEINFNDETWQKLRNKLYTKLLLDYTEVLLAYTKFKVLELASVGYAGNEAYVAEKIYSTLYGFHRKYTPHLNFGNTTQHTIHTLHTQDITPLSENITVLSEIIQNLIGITAREFEIWRPLFVLSSIVGVGSFLKISNLANLHGKTKAIDNITETRDYLLLISLTKIVERGKWLSIGEITQEFIANSDYTDADRQSLVAVLGRLLKRLGLIIEKRRLNSGIEVNISLEKLHDLCDRLNIPYESKKEGFQKSIA